MSWSFRQELQLHLGDVEVEAEVLKAVNLLQRAEEEVQSVISLLEKSREETIP